MASFTENPSKSSSTSTLLPIFLYTSKSILKLNKNVDSNPNFLSENSAKFMISSPSELSKKIEMYSPEFYAACTFGGILSYGLTHMAVTPLNLVKCNMQLKHICRLWTPRRVFFSMDGMHVWSFKYRFWPNNNSRMYVLENTGDFVNAHGLEQRDYIMVYQHFINLNYVIQAKKSTEQEIYTDYTTTNAVSDYIQLQDHEINRYNQLSWNDQSIVEDVINATTTNSTNTSTSFVYETTGFTSDSPFDFFGGSISNYPRLGHGGIENFGSVDNLSLDDLY